MIGGGGCYNSLINKDLHTYESSRSVYYSASCNPLSFNDLEAKGGANQKRKARVPGPPPRSIFFTFFNAFDRGGNSRGVGNTHAANFRLLRRLIRLLRNI